MKKILGVILILGLFLTLGNAYAASSIDVTIPKYEPYPVEPGEYFDVWVKIENVGNENIENVQLEILPNYPFSIDDATESTYETGKIRTGQEELVKFEVRVDTKAVEGNNTLEIKYKQKSQSELIEEFQILVQTRDAILGISSIERVPEQFKPGNVSKMIIQLENMADSVLTDITLDFDFSNESVPFSPMRTASEKHIYVLDSGEQKNVSFDILTFPDTGSGVYKVPLEMSYYDNIGTKYTKNEVIGFIVGDEPEIDMILDKTTIKKAGTSGTVTFEIINKGLTDIKFLSIELPDTEDFEVLSTNKLYIGELDSDDTDSFEMDIFVKPTNNNKIDLPVHINYLDSGNEEYDLIKNTELRVYNKKEISKYGLNGGLNIWNIVIGLLILAGISWFVYKRLFKKRER